VATNARVDIDVVVKNTQRIDALEKALNRTQKSAVTLGSAAKIAGTAIAAIGVGRSLKSIIDVGKSVESLGLRFKFLFGSAEEGAKAFQTLTKYASRVPFSLGQISAASGNLAVVAKDATELKDILEITGNVAAVTGLDFETAASQIQRAFSGGIAAADVFRERGVRSLLGFAEGAQATAEETRAAFSKTFGKGGKFGTATDEFATTLEGTLSMLGDKLFKIQDIISREFFETLKKELGDLNGFFDENSDTIEEYAQKIGRGLGDAILFTSKALKLLADNADLVKFSLQAIVILGVAKVFYDMTKAIQGATGAMLIFNTVTKANLLIAFVAGLASLLGYLTLTQEKTSELSDTLKEHGDIQNDIDAIWAKTTPTLAEIAVNTEDWRKELIDINAVFYEFSSVVEQAANNTKYLQLQLDQIKISYDNLKGANKSFVEGLLLLGETEYQKLMRIEEERFKKLKDLHASAQINDIEYQQLKTKIEEEGIRAREALKKDEDKKADERHKKNLELVKQFKFAELDLEGMTGDQKVKLAMESGKSLLATAATQNKKAFQAYKALQIAEALIAARSSVMGAFAFGNKIGGPIVGAIFAAGAVAFTAAQINAIKSTEYTGRAKGGMIASGQSYLVGEKGPEIITAGGNGYVTPNNMLGGGDSVTVNFNITSTDATSFDNLLVERRDTIVGVINQALNERGKRSLTA
jgi:hypothetical protein